MCHFIKVFNHNNCMAGQAQKNSYPPEKSMKMVDRSPTFAGIEGGFRKIKGYGMGARTFALMKMCCELGKSASAKRMARIAAKEYVLAGKYAIATMAARGGGLSIKELKDIVREGVKELISLNKSRRARAVAKAAGLYGAVRDAAKGMARERMERGDEDGAMRLGRKYGFDAKDVAEMPSKVPEPPEPGEFETAGECTLPGRI